jgi:hypothetical protein
MAERVMCRTELAIDTPLRRSEDEGEALFTVDFWKRMINGPGGFTAEALPRLPRSSGGNGEAALASAAESQEVLSRVAGLVVVGYRGGLLDFDDAVLFHMHQAAEQEKPVFVQTPYEDVIQAAVGYLPGEVIPLDMKQDDLLSEIRERLGE